MTTPNNDAPTLWTRIQAVNAMLETGEPGNFTTPDKQNHVGYKPQAIIDALNEVFGPGGWGYEEVSSEIKFNDNSTLCGVQVKLWLADCAWQPTAWGEGQQPGHSLGDVRKAAATDAMKKGLSLLSIGGRAYSGELTADAKSGNAAPRPQPARYDDAPWEAAPPRPAAPQGASEEVCPLHNVRWTEGQYGPYHKMPNGQPLCDKKKLARAGA